MGNKLFGVDISKLIKDNIGPGVLPATLTKRTAGTRTAGQLTGGTNPTPTDYDCRGFIDSQSLRNRDGTLVEDGYVKIVLIGDTISGGAVAPDVGDYVLIEGKNYRIDSRVDRDPAGATYSFLATEL